MACCAFAVFLLFNLLAPFAWLRRAWGATPPRHNAAVAWRRGQAGAGETASAGGLRWRRAMTGAVAVELLAVAALSAYWLMPAAAAGPAVQEDWDAWVALHASWCGSGDALTESRFDPAER